MTLFAISKFPKGRTVRTVYKEAPLISQNYQLIDDWQLLARLKISTSPPFLQRVFASLQSQENPAACPLGSWQRYHSPYQAYGTEDSQIPVDVFGITRTLSARYSLPSWHDSLGRSRW